MCSNILFRMKQSAVKMQRAKLITNGSDSIGISFMSQQSLDRINFSLLCSLMQRRVSHLHCRQCTEWSASTEYQCSEKFIELVIGILRTEYCVPGAVKVSPGIFANFSAIAWNFKVIYLRHTILLIHLVVLYVHNSLISIKVAYGVSKLSALQ